MNTLSQKKPSDSGPTSDSDYVKHSWEWQFWQIATRNILQSTFCPNIEFDLRCVCVNPNWFFTASEYTFITVKTFANPKARHPTTVVMYFFRVYHSIAMVLKSIHMNPIAMWFISLWSWPVKKKSEPLFQS